MIILTYILIFILLSFFLIFYFFYTVFIIESLIRGHDLPTTKKTTKILINIIKKYKPDTKNIYDLGCGHGALSIKLKKSFPKVKIYAVDDSLIRIFFAKAKSKILNQKINFNKQDLFKMNLSEAEIVYTYLWYDLMPILEKKLQTELKPGSLVITNTSHFPNWRPVEIITTRPKPDYKDQNFEKLFIYLKQ